MDIIICNLEHDMFNDEDIVRYISSDKIAEDFYSALCNMRWRKIGALSEDERIIEKLKGNESDIWSCTWRYAAGIIAEIRNKYYNTNNDYMDFYCAGHEGQISELVKQCFNKIGWEPYPYK
jgi:hypothetical protein